MKTAINLRLQESVIYTLNKLSENLNSTKTEIVEQAIRHFSKDIVQKNNNLLQFAGSLKDYQADKILLDIKTNKNPLKTPKSFMQ